MHYCKLCITGNWLHLLGGFRQEGRVRCHQERVCPSSRPLILQRVFKREKCWMSWFSFHNLSRIVNCAIGHSHSSLSLSLSFVLSLCLTLSKDGYDDAAAHEHGWTLGHLGRMMARPQWQQIPLPFHTSPNPEIKINFSVIIASSLIQSRLGPYYS